MTTNIKVDSHNKVTANELAEIVKVQMKSIVKDHSISSKLPPLLISGSPGCGKSSIVKSVADDLGIKFIDLRLAQMESCDIRGLPVPNGNGFDWNVANVFPRDPDSVGILFLDEITSCSKDVQVASYQLILDRALGEYKLPDGWYICAAGNLSTDRAVVMSMSSALANRFLHVQLDADAEDWCEWAQVNDIRPEVLGFIKYKPGFLFKMENENLERGWPSPRSWEKVSRMIDIYKDINNEIILRKIVYGLIGNGVGTEFMEFYKHAKNIDDILVMMTDPASEVIIPEKADEKYSMVAAVSYLLWRGKTTVDEQSRINGFYRIIMKMPADFATLLMTMAISSGDKKLCAKNASKLFQHSMYKSWQKEFGKHFKKNISFN